MEAIDLSLWQEELCRIGRKVAHSVLEIYQRQFKIECKEDGSYLTEADLLAHDIIVSELSRLTPSLPVLSEESAKIPYGERKQWESYWLVDPLDGTREFVNKRDDFTINIALIEKGQPILGMVYVPVGDLCYVASRESKAYLFIEGRKEILQVNTKPNNEPVIAISFSHADKKTQVFLDAFPKKYHLVRRGSMIKVCLIAEAKADLYPRLGPTSEWDTAAGQCILEAAGGRLTSWDGQALKYNTKESLLNPPFVAYAPSVDACLDFEKESLSS
ncbi:MAG: 3'(2'),5'-bisphosphate nucleotidase CysQ [Candidatus Oxydemutatoraceae bacterium WSBS_2016_MAG_OTU14]